MLDLWRGTLSPRRVLALVNHLPRESATVRALRGERVRWSDAEYLLAAAVDRLSILIWQQTKDGHAGKNRPDPWPRPGIILPREPTDAEKIARLVAQRNRVLARSAVYRAGREADAD